MKYIKTFENHNHSEIIRDINWFIEKNNISEDVTELNCDKNEIDSLKGIEKLTKLEELSCQYNNLKSLKGIEKLNKLTKLYCNDNYLTSLKGIENLSSLIYLYFYRNYINSLKEISKLEKLRWIYAFENPLPNYKNLDPLNLKGLKEEFILEEELNELINYMVGREDGALETISGELFHPISFKDNKITSEDGTVYDLFDIKTDINEDINI